MEIETYNSKIKTSIVDIRYMIFQYGLELILIQQISIRFEAIL